jgi:hypothetical protein
VVRAWVKLIWNSLGIAVVAAAAQLAIAQALGIIRWDATYPAGKADGWNGLLTWVGFIYAFAVLGGASIGRRAVRRPTKPDTMPARVAAAFAAGVGASIAVGLAWLPARAAKPPVSVHPELLVALTAGVAIVVGIVIALIAMSVPPVAGGVRAAAAWIWLVGIGSAIAGYLTYRPYAPPRLGVIDAPSIIPVGWWSGPLVMIAVAAVLGAVVAAVARWAEAGRFGIAASGFAGPAVVAAAYLIAGPGSTNLQLEPYRAALISVGAGLLGSVAVAIPKPRADAASARANRQGQHDQLPPYPGEVAAAAPPGRMDPNEPLLDEPFEVGAYPQEPAPAADREATYPGAAVQPRPLQQQPVQQQPVQPLAPTTASARPAAIGQPAPMTMGQPPVRTYEEDYSDWLRDLGHVPGQRTAEDQRN